jgi:hypothetical protein
MPVTDQKLEARVETVRVCMKEEIANEDTSDRLSEGVS